MRRRRLSSAGKKKGQGARTSKQPTLSDQNNTKEKRSSNQAAKISRRVAFAKTYLDTYVTDSQSIHVPASRARAPVLLPSRDISSCIVELFFAFLVVLCTTSRRPSWHGRLQARSLNDTRCSCAEWERPNAEPPLFHVREVERMRGVSEPHGPWPALTGPCTSQPFASVVAKTRVLASQLQQFQTRREPSEAIQLTRVTRIASGPCFCTFLCRRISSVWVEISFLLRAPFEVFRVRVLCDKKSWQPLASLASQLLGEPSLTQAREW